MKFKFYFGILLALFIGFTFANGVVYLGKSAFNLVVSGAYIVYESVNNSSQNNLATVVLSQTELSISENKSGFNSYHFKDNSKSFPQLSAEAYLVADLDNGYLIKQKNREQQYPIASLTKLVTALTSIETLDQNQITTISQRAIDTYGEQGGLSFGQKILISDLLYPLLLESSNDAAEVLAEHSGRNLFLANLNGKAKSIGMVNSYFDDPSGLSHKNVSTIEDLFKLTRYLYSRSPEILNITRLKHYQNANQKWFNIIPFRSDSNYWGGKNGYTDEAYYSLISIFKLPLSKISKEQDRKIIIILLRSLNVENDTRDILRWLSDNVYYE